MRVYVCISHSLYSSYHLHVSYPFPLVKCSPCSAQAQLNLINLWVVKVSDHFHFQIWTSPVTLQSIKPNYPHYKGNQILLSNPFSFPRQHRLELMQTAHVWFGSEVNLISIPNLFIHYPYVHLCKIGNRHCPGWMKPKMCIASTFQSHFYIPFI